MVTRTKKQDETPSEDVVVADAEAQADVADKPKRKKLTIEERIAKAEAEAEALREKAKGADRKRLEVIDSEVAKLTTRKDEIQGKLDGYKAEREVVAKRVDGEPSTESTDG